MATESQRGPHQVVLGLLVIAIGVLFLLDNLGVIAFRHAVAFWPLALIAGGAVLAAGGGYRESRRGRGRRSNRKAGVILMIVGLVLLLQRLGLMDLSWRIVWPVMLMAAGGLILYRTLGVQRMRDRPDFAGADLDSVIDVTAIMGGVERRIASPDFRGGDVTAVMGGCELDLRACSMLKEATLDVFAFWGGISIRVPADWTVVMQGRPLIGAFTQKTAAPPDNGKRLVISGYAVMGGIDVRN
jgi:hypothetical protein